MTYTTPYYAVIFVSRLKENATGYGKMADYMAQLATHMPGYLGIDSVRDSSGTGITVSYWQDEASIAAWKAHAEHQAAQNRGKRDWYEQYDLHVARVDRAYSGPAGR